MKQLQKKIEKWKNLRNLSIHLVRRILTRGNHHGYERQFWMHRDMALQKEYTEKERDLGHTPAM